MTTAPAFIAPAAPSTLAAFLAASPLGSASADGFVAGPVVPEDGQIGVMIFEPKANEKSLTWDGGVKHADKNKAGYRLPSRVEALMAFQRLGRRTT